MAQKSIELILLRQLSSYLGIPAFIIDEKENVIFCNSSAESVLGFTFSETSEISLPEWTAIFSIQANNGLIVDLKDSSIYWSFTHQKLSHEIYHIEDLNDHLKKVSVFTLPIIGQLHHFHGVVVFFQEIA